MLLPKLMVFISFLSFLLLASCGSSQKSGDGLGSLAINLDVKKVVLENGLRVLIMENHKLPIFSYYTFFDVGGRHESSKEGTTGATHFLEHMMFKGAKKYGPGEFDTFIESNGGSNNAYTSFDNTVYYENLPSGRLERIVDMEADRMSNLLLEKGPFISEKKVVLEERKMRYENRPGGKLYLNMMKSVFAGTPYGGSVIGSATDVKNLKREQMRSFFNKYYAPNNAILVIVGDVDTKKTLEFVKKYYGKLSYSKHIDNLKKKMDDPKLFVSHEKLGKELKFKGASPDPIFMMAFDGEKLGTRKSFVMDILGSALSDGDSSYLNQKYVRGKKPLLSRISLSNYNLKYEGVFFLEGKLKSSAKLSDVKNKMAAEMKIICQAIDETSLKRTKNNYLVSYYQGIQTNAGVARFLGQRENIFGDYQFYKKELKIYDSINVKEVVKVCHDIFDGNNSTFVSVWDKHSVDTL